MQLALPSRGGSALLPTCSRSRWRSVMATGNSGLGLRQPRVLRQTKHPAYTSPPTSCKGLRGSHSHQEPWRLSALCSCHSHAKGTCLCSEARGTAFTSSGHIQDLSLPFITLSRKVKRQQQKKKSCQGDEIYG